MTVFRGTAGGACNGTSIIRNRCVVWPQVVHATLGGEQLAVVDGDTLISPTTRETKRRKVCARLYNVLYQGVLNVYHDPHRTID